MDGECVNDNNAAFTTYYLKPQGSVVYPLETPMMMENATYEFILFVSKKGRPEIGQASYTLSVVMGVPPQISIQCQVNCAAKQLRNEKISLEARCTNCEPGEKIKWNWRMEKKVTEVGLFVEDAVMLQQCISTKVDSINLVIKKDCLSPDVFQYRVKLEGSRGRAMGFSMFTLILNKGPDCSMANYRVTPKEGIPVEKIF